jgi:hypothetical protein
MQKVLFLLAFGLWGNSVWATPYTYIIWGAANYGENANGGHPEDLPNPRGERSPDQFISLEVTITRLAREKHPQVRLYLNDITPKAAELAKKFAQKFIKEKGYPGFEVRLWVGDIATVRLPNTDGAEWRNPEAVFFFKGADWPVPEIPREVIFQELANASRTGLYVTSMYPEEFRRFIGEGIYWYQQRPVGRPPLATQAEGPATGYVWPSGVHFIERGSRALATGHGYRIRPDPNPGATYSGRTIPRNGKIICREAVLETGASEEETNALMGRTFRPREVK